MRNLVVVLVAIIGTTFVSTAQDRVPVKENPKVMHTNYRISKKVAVKRPARPLASKRHVAGKRDLYIHKEKQCKPQKHEVKRKHHRAEHRKRAIK